MPKARKSAFDPHYIEIVDRLVAHRKRIGMSQAELGAAYGEDQPFVSRVERRQRRIDVWEFVRLCRALNTDPASILDNLD